MNINIKIDLEQVESDLFEVALNAYRAWCKTGKNFDKSYEVFLEWDRAICVYAERFSIKRGVAVDMIYRAVEAEFKDVRVK